MGIFIRRIDTQQLGKNLNRLAVPIQFLQYIAEIAQGTGVLRPE
ncbi:hypothetical protein GALL_497760 [mine drainage metagenome]|uniref:Uncharacterized protein n=1 Tax=mine drainage metagenome TaxID=410659 RepID=A0A1J5PTM2_9ZZZZ